MSWISGPCRLPSTDYTELAHCELLASSGEFAGVDDEGEGGSDD